MKTAIRWDARHCLQPSFCLIGVLISSLSCSPIETETGRCKKLTDAKYVAALSDTDGKPWKIEVIPEAADLTCDATSTNRTDGIIVFSARILDSEGQTKPGLRINGRFSGSSPTAANDSQPGFYPNPYQVREGDTDDVRTVKERNRDKIDDIATDACGVAVFYVKWVCPDPKKSIGGSFYVESGPLFSKPVKVTLENSVQPDVVAPAPAPAPAP